MQKSFRNSTIIEIGLSRAYYYCVKNYFKKLEAKKHIVILRLSKTKNFEENQLFQYAPLSLLNKVSPTIKNRQPAFISTKSYSDPFKINF